jgi:hypothetical protein
MGNEQLQARVDALRERYDFAMAYAQLRARVGNDVRFVQAQREQHDYRVVAASPDKTEEGVEAVGAAMRDIAASDEGQQNREDAICRVVTSICELDAPAIAQVMAHALSNGTLPPESHRGLSAYRSWYPNVRKYLDLEIREWTPQSTQPYPSYEQAKSSIDLCAMMKWLGDRSVEEHVSNVARLVAHAAGWASAGRVKTMWDDVKAQERFKEAAWEFLESLPESNQVKSLRVRTGLLVRHSYHSASNSTNSICCSAIIKHNDFVGSGYENIWADGCRAG